MVIFALPAVAEEVTIAALGDSLTQGFGLSPEDGFAPQLERWLGERGQEVSILNAGVSGDTSAGGLSRIAWTLTPEVDALIVALGGNDVLRGIDPAVTRQNLDAILKVATERGLPVLLVGIAAPANYGPDYKQAFDATYPELAAQHDTLLVTDFLGGIRDAAPTTSEALAYMQGDGIHPNTKGVALIVEAMGPQVEALVDRVSP